MGVDKQKVKGTDLVDWRAEVEDALGNRGLRGEKHESIEKVKENF